MKRTSRLCSQSIALMTKWNTGHDIADVRSLLECYVEFSITSVSNKCFNDTDVRSTQIWHQEWIKLKINVVTSTYDVIVFILYNLEKGNWNFSSIQSRLFRSTCLGSL